MGIGIPPTKSSKNFVILETNYLGIFSSRPMDRGGREDHFKPLFMGDVQLQDFVPSTEISPSGNAGVNSVLPMYNSQDIRADRLDLSHLVKIGLLKKKSKITIV